MARPPLQSFSPRDSDYERPTQAWVCGWAADGHACRIGPSSRGRCRATFECAPRKRQGRWECTRSARDGGKCAHGPRPDGTCCRPIPRCQPVRSVRAKRGVVTRAAVAGTIGLVLLVFGGRHLAGLRQAVSSPGALSMVHAPIAECASCHRSETGDSMPGDAPVAHAAALGPVAGCIDCHRVPRAATIDAHGVPPTALAEVTDSLRGDSTALTGMRIALAHLVSGRARAPGTAVPCVDCHEEHRGRGWSMVDVSVGKCQACHVRAIADLAGHPEFAGYPALPPVGFQFRHQKHEVEYFPKDDTPFTCGTCHAVDAANGGIRTGTFAEMCAPCHADQIEQTGMPVFQLPGVDYDLLGDFHVSIGEWPRDANLDLEQDMSPWTRLLLATDPRTAGLMDQLSDVDLYYLDRDATEARAAGRLVWDFKALIHELATQGRSAYLARLRRAEPQLSARDVAALVDQLPADSSVGAPEWQGVLREASRRWFPDLDAELARHARGTAVPTHPVEAADAPDTAADSTGWYITDSYQVAYRARGHADDTYRRWIDLAHREGDTASTMAKAARTLDDADGPGACMKCHRTDAEGSGAAAWQSALEQRPAPSGLANLTPFAHGPHLATPCKTCHAYHGDFTFAPIAKTTCMTCHDGRRVSDACLTCHRYHAKAFTARAPIARPTAADSTIAPADSAAKDGSS